METQNSDNLEDVKKTFYSLSKAFVEHVFEYLKNKSKEYKIVNIELELPYLWLDIQNFDEYHKLVDYMQDTSPIKEYITGHPTTKMFDLFLVNSPSGIFQALITDIIKEENDEISFDEELFREYFKKMWHIITSDYLYVRTLVPLYNFVSDEKTLTVFENEDKIIRIIEPSREELNELKRQFLTIVPRDILVYVKHFVELIYKTEKIDYDKSPDIDGYFEGIEIAEKDLNRIISALRLLKKGEFHYPIIKIEILEWPSIAIPTFRIPPTTIPYLASPYLYTLEKGELSKFKEIFERLSPEVSQGFLRIPLERFNNAFSKFDSRDRLIDYMIAFEALFSDGSGGLRYKISLRAARYLGGTPEERLELFKLFKLTYDVRSDIVHGRGGIRRESRNKLIRRYEESLRRHGDDLENMDEFLIWKLSEEIEDLLRRTILKCLDENITSQEQLRQRIEDQFFL